MQPSLLPSTLTCPPPLAAADSAGATLSSKGSEEYATNGTADFTSLQLKGTINQSYALQARQPASQPASQHVCN